MKGITTPTAERERGVVLSISVAKYSKLRLDATEGWSTSFNKDSNDDVECACISYRLIPDFHYGYDGPISENNYIEILNPKNTESKSRLSSDPIEGATEDIVQVSLLERLNYSKTETKYLISKKRKDQVISYSGTSVRYVRKCNEFLEWAPIWKNPQEVIETGEITFNRSGLEFKYPLRIRVIGAPFAAVFDVFTFPVQLVIFLYVWAFKLNDK